MVPACIAGLHGEGEVAGGIVILRFGKNAREVIATVKAKLDTVQSSLPENVKIVTTCNCSQLIARTIENLSHNFLEEWEDRHLGETLDNGTRWAVITNASVEVRPVLFINLLIITLSLFIIPVSYKLM